MTNTLEVLAHSVALLDLTPSQTYCYQVQSGHAVSVTQWTSDAFFTTLATQIDVYLPIVLKEWAP